MGVTVWLAAASLLFTATCFATAQQPTPEDHFAKTREQLVADTKVQLKANDLATIAWGAHAAAEYRLADCIPELVSALGPLAQRAGAAEEYTALAVLDALVETDAVVRGEALVPFLSGWSRDPALLLLGRRAKDNRTLLLAQFRKLGPMTEGGLACGTWLATLGDRDFLRELLLTPITVDIVVTDLNRNVVDILQQVDSLVLSHYRPKAPDGFPRIFHHLHVHDAGDAASIRTGRVERIGGFCLPFNPYEPGLRGARNAWLRRLVGEHATKLQFDRAPLLTVEWRGADALHAAIAERRAQIEADHRALVDACVAAKLVQAEAVSRTPTITVELTDYRQDQKVALPQSNEWRIREW